MKNALKPFAISILLILTLSLSNGIQAQEKILVERWRLEMVVKELMEKDLMDSMLVEKDSVIQKMQKTDSLRITQIDALLKRVVEKQTQIDILGEFNTSYMNEIVETRKESRKYKKQRNVIAAAAVLLLSLLALN